MRLQKVYETVVDWEYEQKCTTSYEEECHGYGYHQECEKVIFVATFYIFVILCPQVPKEHCKQVPKKVEKQVPRTKCRKVPDKRCQDFPINVPRKECKERRDGTGQQPQASQTLSPRQHTTAAHTQTRSARACARETCAS